MKRFWAVLLSIPRSLQRSRKIFSAATGSGSPFSRRERVRAGQAAARAQGKRWGGSEKGRRVKVTDLHVETIWRLKAENVPVAAIARTVGLSRPTIYSVLAEGPTS